MRPPPHGAARLLTGAVLAAALLLPAAAGAVATQAGPVPAADGTKGQALPAMPGALDAGNTPAVCTPASREKAQQRDWSRQRLDLDQLHRHSSGEGVTVALVGTGVAPGAAGLRGRVRAVGAAAEDCVGHGTFLAGLIAGSGGGDTRLAGVAPRARILALRGTDTHGRAGAARVASAVRQATAAKAEVIVIAVALPRRDAALTRAVAGARRAGAVVVAAATPDPPRSGADEVPVRTYWPAGEPGVLSVADMLPSGARPEASPATDDIDLAAPGAGVVSGGPRGDGHYLGEGSSVAAAYAGGAAAAVRAAHPDESAAAVLRRLTSTAYPADIPQLDPYAAVTTVLGGAEKAATGTVGAGGPLSTRDTSDADRAADRARLLVLLGSGVVLTVAWGALVLPRARSRRWRPAGAGETGTD